MLHGCCLAAAAVVVPRARCCWLLPGSRAHRRQRRRRHMALGAAARRHWAGFFAAVAMLALQFPSGWQRASFLNSGSQRWAARPAQKAAGMLRNCTRGQGAGWVQTGEAERPGQHALPRQCTHGDADTSTHCVDRRCHSSCKCPSQSDGCTRGSKAACWLPSDEGMRSRCKRPDAQARRAGRPSCCADPPAAPARCPAVGNQHLPLSSFLHR